MLRAHLVPFVLALALLAACSGRPDGGAKYRIAVIPKGTGHEFWQAVAKGARAADAELADLEIVWKGPAGEGDTGAQIALVESFLADGVHGVCLAPLDARALVAPVRQALQRNVPVVVFDSGLAEPELGIVSYVATDNRRGGELAGEHLAALLQGKGRVLVLRYQVGSESTEAREAGCLAALARAPGIEVVSSDRHGGPDEAKAVEVSENLLATFGDRLDGVFCSNESSTAGMLAALQRDPRRLAGRIKLVGFDSSAVLARGLRNRTVHGIVLQDPVGMGHQAVHAMHKRLTGQPVPARIPTGEVLATPENLDQPRVRALLFPGS